MIDLHCHILPCVDDGSRSLDESLVMARFCVADGITYITATPHCSAKRRLFRQQIIPAVVQLNADLQAAKEPLTILPGSEINVVSSIEYKREFGEGIYCHLGDKKLYTLFEFGWRARTYPNDAPELISWVRKQGMIPIVPHPERHIFFREKPELVKALVDAGAWIQITVDSLLGNHGEDAKTFGDNFLKMFPEAILATDAHRTNRCSGLSAGYKWVSDNHGQQRSDDLRDRANLIKTALLA